jgi:hypothetical protein
MFNFEFWMTKGSGGRGEVGRAHAKGAERKAGHRLKKIGEDVFASP